MPNVIVLGSGAFGRCLDIEGRALINGISALRNEALESLLAPSTIWGHIDKVPPTNQEEGPH